VIDTQTGEALGPCTNGELCIKSPAMMLGYVNNPEATASTIDADGWLHTGKSIIITVPCYSMERYCHRMASVCLSVCPSVRPSVTLMIPDHICWATWNFITRLISPVPSLAVRKISAI